MSLESRYRAEDMEAVALQERFREAAEAAREYLKKVCATIVISLSEKMKEPTPQEKKRLLDGIKNMSAAVAGIAILAHASPTQARVRHFSPAPKAPEISQSTAEGLTTEIVPILEGTSTFVLEGPAESLPEKLPKVLERSLPQLEAPTASGSAGQPKRHDSPFVLDEQHTEDRTPLLSGEKKSYVIATYRTKDGAALKDPILVKIPYILKNGAEPDFLLTTDEDKKFTFGKAEIVSDIPSKKDSSLSHGFYGEQSVRYPLSDDGNVSVSIGLAYGTEHGKPGTTVHTPGLTGGDKGYKVSPSIGMVVTPSSLSEFTLKMQPHFTEGTLDVAQRRPLAFMGSWVARSDEPNWSELRIDGAVEMNGDLLMTSPISRGKGRIEATQAFINPAWGLGVTVGGVAENTQLVEQGADRHNPTSIGMRFGATATLPEKFKNRADFKWLTELLGDKELDFGVTVSPGMSGDPTGAKIAIDARIEKAKKKAKKESE